MFFSSGIFVLLLFPSIESSYIWISTALKSTKENFTTKINLQRKTAELTWFYLARIKIHTFQ